MTISVTLRILCAVMFVILTAFAFLQFNDPDPVVWVGFYLACALVPFLLVFKVYSRVLFWVTIVFCAVALTTHIIGLIEYTRHAGSEALMQSMNPNKPYIEEAREFLGGVIALSLLVICRLSVRPIQADNAAS